MPGTTAVFISAVGPAHLRPAMTTNDNNRMFCAATGNLSLKQTLTSICALSRAAMTGEGSTAAAAIMLADASGEELKPAASAGLEKGEDAILHDAARAFLAMENLGLEGFEPPYAIDELGDESATRDFGTAWAWPLAGNRGERLGLLVGFQNHPLGPGEIPREAMGHAAGLAATAIENGRSETAGSDRGGMLETVVENVNQGIALFDKEFRLLHFNSVYQSLYDFPDGFLKRGLPYAEVLRHLIERGEYGGVDTESFLQKRMDSLDEGSEWRKLRHRPNGTVIAVYRKNLPGGGAIATFTDVTADLRLTMENQRTTQLMESTVNNIRHGIRVIDGDGRLVLWNQRYLDMSGYPENLMRKGMPYTELLHNVTKREGMNDEDAQEFVKSRLARIRQTECGATTRDFPNGMTVRIRRAAMPEGGMVATYTDISNLIKAESELARKSDLLTTTLDNITQGLLVLDADLNVVLFNDAYLRLMKLETGDVELGMNYRDVLQIFAENGEFAAENCTTEASIARRLHLAKKGGFRHSIHQRPNGTIVSVYRKPMPGGGRVMNYTDITDLKRVEGELVTARDLAETANRSKTEFLANMSHELRTPLNAIIGFSEIMESGMMGPMEDPRYNDYVHSINESGNHLLSLINDILDLSTIEVGRAVLEEENLDLVATIESCLMLIREQAGNKNLTLASELPPRFPPFRGDRRRLKQIFINLLQNALKFTPQGGTVTATLAHEPGGPVRVIIKDTGIGMSAEDIPRALERFSQVETGLQRRYEGTGLGLPLARAMAILHGGDIEIESSEGKGTTVRVILPENRIATAVKAPRRAASRRKGAQTR